jgi:hypothetical protein
MLRLNAGSGISLAHSDKLLSITNNQFSIQIYMYISSGSQNTYPIDIYIGCIQVTIFPTVPGLVITITITNRCTGQPIYTDNFRNLNYLSPTFGTVNIALEQDQNNFTYYWNNQIFFVTTQLQLLRNEDFHNIQMLVQGNSWSVNVPQFGVNNRSMSLDELLYWTDNILSPEPIRFGASICKCFNIPADISTVCSSHGICNGNDTCCCDNCYFGEQCQFADAQCLLLEQCRNLTRNNCTDVERQLNHTIILLEQCEGTSF